MASHGAMPSGARHARLARHDPARHRPQEHETPAVHVGDVARSLISVFLPLCLEDGWIDDQRRLLQLVRREWPSEVLQTTPGAYE
ncbi:DUF5959 family protein [Streptomyces sp. NPDC047990]|uniref:DUF5959 family protein n=1 Tax=Streptomyces sp. NPDC047990 TaxID=3365496 RepID=UPI003710F401